MPTSEALRIELRTIGLDEGSFRAIALLPLVEVAWADHAIQTQEVETILQIAKGHGLLTQNGSDVLKGWLKQRPSPEFFTRGRSLLVALAHHDQSGAGAGAGSLSPESLGTVLEFCGHVAEAAGGLFGVLFTVSPNERRAIRAIAKGFERESEKHADPERGIVGRSLTMSWKDLLTELDT